MASCDSKKQDLPLTSFAVGLPEAILAVVSRPVVISSPISETRTKRL